MLAGDEDLFPSFNTFADWPSVKPFWKDSAEFAPQDDLQTINTVPFNAEVWAAILPDVRSEIDQYAIDMHQIALERVTVVYDRKGLRLPSDPFEPATSHFRLKVDRWPWVADAVLPFPAIHRHMRELENIRSSIKVDERPLELQNFVKPVEFRLREGVVPDRLA